MSKECPSFIRKKQRGVSHDTPRYKFDYQLINRITRSPHSGT
nr:MAG TPA: hypothetical protein [Caudoviricetes sp.]